MRCWSRPSSRCMELVAETRKSGVKEGKEPTQQTQQTRQQEWMEWRKWGGEPVEQGGSFLGAQAACWPRSLPELSASTGPGQGTLSDDHQNSSTSLLFRVVAYRQPCCDRVCHPRTDRDIARFCSVPCLAHSSGRLPSILLAFFFFEAAPAVAPSSPQLPTQFWFPAAALRRQSVHPSIHPSIRDRLETPPSPRPRHHPLHCLVHLCIPSVGPTPKGQQD